MESIQLRCEHVFPKSRKLNHIQPSAGQMENVLTRLRQIFTEDELTAMDEQTLTRQVERVWPIAQYIDEK